MLDNNLNENICGVISHMFSIFDGNIILVGSSMFKLLNIFDRQPKDLDIIVYGFSNKEFYEILESNKEEDCSNSYDSDVYTMLFNGIKVDIFLYDSNKEYDIINYVKIDGNIIPIDNPKYSILAKNSYLNTTNNIRNIYKHYYDIEKYNLWAFMNNFPFTIKVYDIDYYIKSLLFKKEKVEIHIKERRNYSNVWI